jgi:hypothetical protein
MLFKYSSIFMLFVLLFVQEQTMADTKDNMQSPGDKGLMPEVRLSLQQQIAGNIKVTPLKRTHFTPVQKVYATVLDLQPLFDMRSQWNTTLSEYNVTKVKLANATTEYHRSQKLFESHHNASLKTLQDNRATVEAYQATLASRAIKLKDIAGTIQQQYGDAIASAIPSDASHLMDKLLDRQQVILRVPVTVSIQQQLKQSMPVSLKVNDDQGKLIVATKLSASPQVDASVQGNAYLYLLPASMPAGLRLTVNIPTSNTAVAGYSIPESAVVWFGGQPWVYLQNAEGHFTRFSLYNRIPADHTYFTTTPFPSAQGLVTQGAQLVFSEEQKQQASSGSIVTSQCPDPPECDG